MELVASVYRGTSVVELMSRRYRYQGDVNEHFAWRYLQSKRRASHVSRSCSAATLVSPR